MPQAVQIIIPKPCHENWHNMTPNEQGRYCGSCQKTVVDFSGMSDKELIDYISKPGASACGRFSNDQLNKNLKSTVTRKRFSWSFFRNIMLASLLSAEANAQVATVKKKRPATQQRALLARTVNIAIVEDNYLATPQKIVGAIFDSKTRQPVSGARVRSTDIKREVVTDSLGRFSLTVENRDTITLEVSAIGRDKLKLSLDKNTSLQNIQITLTDVAYLINERPVDLSFMLTGTMGGYSVYRNTLPRKVKRIVRRWFRAVFKKN
jgi:hypothetical protein